MNKKEGVQVTELVFRVSPSESDEAVYFSDNKEENETLMRQIAGDERRVQISQNLNARISGKTEYPSRLAVQYSMLILSKSHREEDLFTDRLESQNRRIINISDVLKVISSRTFPKNQDLFIRFWSLDNQEKLVFMGIWLRPDMIDMFGEEPANRLIDPRTAIIKRKP